MVCASGVTVSALFLAKSDMVEHSSHFSLFSSMGNGSALFIVANKIFVKDLGKLSNRYQTSQLCEVERKKICSFPIQVIGSEHCKYWAILTCMYTSDAHISA